MDNYPFLLKFSPKSTAEGCSYASVLKACEQREQGRKRKNLPCCFMYCLDVGSSTLKYKLEKNLVL